MHLITFLQWLSELESLLDQADTLADISLLQNMLFVLNVAE